MKSFKTDKEINDAFDALLRSEWLYLGCDEWRDPVDNVKYMTSGAYEVMLQRAKATGKKEHLPKTRKPRLFMCHDWRRIVSEMKHQLLHLE